MSPALDGDGQSPKVTGNPGDRVSVFV